MASILVVDDEVGLRDYVSDVLVDDGHDVQVAKDGIEGLQKAQAKKFDLIITDMQMPNMSGMQLLAAIKNEQPEVAVIVLTAHGSVNSAVEAMKSGAFDYVNKPISEPDEISLLAKRAIESVRVRDVAEGSRPASQETKLSYGAKAMVPVENAIEKVAKTNATVLLHGESGTGKEVTARFIHQHSKRNQMPFVAINCATLSDTLLESELFGHEKGAFTGATERKRGKLELCNGGTFFFDEIGETKLELQAKLLRVLQEKKFERVGGNQIIDADMRIIAATNRDLKAMIKEGTFREDLYHRLAVFPIKIPPLRERATDIVPLSKFLLQEIGANLGKTGLTIDNEVAATLEREPWHGNVRELRNVLERAAILAEGKNILVQHLWIEPGNESAAPVTLAQAEAAAIKSALDKCNGNRREAAALLEIGERTLYDKIKKYEL